MVLHKPATLLVKKLIQVIEHRPYKRCTSRMNNYKVLAFFIKMADICHHFSAGLVSYYTPFTQSSWLDELARRAAMLARRANSMFARCLLDVCSTFARSCKRGIIPSLHNQARSTSCYKLARRASSMFARRLLDVCAMYARCLLDDCFV